MERDLPGQRGFRRPPQPGDHHIRDRDGVWHFPFLPKHFRTITVAPPARMRKLRHRSRRHLAKELQSAEQRLRCCQEQSRVLHCSPVPHTCCTVVGQSWLCVERGDNREWCWGKKLFCRTLRMGWDSSSHEAGYSRAQGEPVSVSSTGRDCPATAHPRWDGDTGQFPRPGIAGWRGAGLSVPPCTALAVLCCSGLPPA